MGANGAVRDSKGGTRGAALAGAIGPVEIPDGMPVSAVVVGPMDYTKGGDDRWYEPAVEKAQGGNGIKGECSRVT